MSGLAPPLVSRHWLELSRSLRRAIVTPWAWLTGAVYVLTYVLLDWISYDYAFAPVGITPWNPPPGLSLVLLLHGGLGFAPWLFVASVMADVVVRGLSIWHEILGAASIIALIYISAAVLLRMFGLDTTLARLRDVILLLIVAVIASGIVALLLIGLYVMEGQVDAAGAMSGFVRAWICDSSGILVATPVLLRHANVTLAQIRARLARLDFETIMQAAALALALWFVFVHERTDEFKFFYLIVLPIIWIALRHGLDGACFANLGVQIGLIVLAHYRNFTADIITEFHAFTLLPTVTGLVIGAIAGERAAAEQALRDQQAAFAHVARVSVAGEMASALAHELSQPIGATVTYIAEAQRLVRTNNNPAVLAESLTLAARQAKRAGEVLSRLRNFLYRRELSLGRVPVQAVLSEAIGLVQGEAAMHKIKIERSFETIPVPIMADSVQIQQVIVNLVRNAIEAIADAAMPARRIEIRQRSAGDDVEIMVMDTGPGVSPEIESRLFAPFASTKPQGMGLGLVISRSILQAHGGTLRWEPGPGRRATFVMTLPRARDHAA